MIKPEDLFADLSKGQLKTIYLFSGAEDFLLEQALQQFTTRNLADDPTGTNKDRLDADELSAQQILDACLTIPFAAAQRLVIVRNTGRLSAEDQKFLAANLATIPTTTQLLL